MHPHISGQILHGTQINVFGVLLFPKIGTCFGLDLREHKLS
jgi:hypothetical protein